MPEEKSDHIELAVLDTVVKIKEARRLFDSGGTADRSLRDEIGDRFITKSQENVLLVAEMIQRSSFALKSAEYHDALMTELDDIKALLEEIRDNDSPGNSGNRDDDDDDEDDDDDD